MCLQSAIRDLVRGKITWVGTGRARGYRFRRSCRARSLRLMPYLKLRNARSGDVFEFERDEVRIGRTPDLELTLEGEGSEVVSGNHARIAFRDGMWVLEDLGSTNGTFLDEERLTVGQSVSIATGSVV